MYVMLWDLEWRSILNHWLVIMSLLYCWLSYFKLTKFLLISNDQSVSFDQPNACQHCQLLAELGRTGYGNPIAWKLLMSCPPNSVNLAILQHSEAKKHSFYNRLEEIYLRMSFKYLIMNMESQWGTPNPGTPSPISCPNPGIFLWLVN